MRVSAISLDTKDQRAYLSASFSFGGESHRLWYSLPVEHARWFSTDRFDGFVVALLLCAMRSAEDLQVEGPMSSRLWHSLNGSYIPMVAKVFGLPAIKLTAAALLEQETSAQGVATGFSGGIDSFAAIIQHFVRETSPAFRVSHLLFHHVGAHSNNEGSRGQKEADGARTLFQQRFERVRPFAESSGCPWCVLIPIFPRWFQLTS